MALVVCWEGLLTFVSTFLYCIIIAGCLWCSNRFVRLRSLFNILFLYGMETTYFRYSSKPEHTEEYIFNHIFTQIIISTVFLVAVLVVFINPIAHFTEYTSSKDYLYLFIVILATDALLAIPFARWRKENKAGWFAGVKLGAILFNVFLNILLVAYIPEWLKALKLPH